MLWSRSKLTEYIHDEIYKKKKKTKVILRPQKEMTHTRIKKKQNNKIKQQHNTRHQRI